MGWEVSASELAVACGGRGPDHFDPRSVDRLGRSLQHLVGVLSDLQARDVGLYLHVQGLDTTTPSGRAMYQLLGVFAEFEREMIRERVLAGIDRARARGKRLGRPSIPDQQAQAVRNALAQGLGIRATARATGTAITTVARIKKDIEQPDEESEHDLPIRDLMISSRSASVIEPIPHRAPSRRQGQTVQGSCPSPSHPAKRPMRWQGIITVPPTATIV